jgi:hypothetical protein
MFSKLSEMVAAADFDHYKDVDAVAEPEQVNDQHEEDLYKSIKVDPEKLLTYNKTQIELLKNIFSSKGLAPQDVELAMMKALSSAITQRRIRLHLAANKPELFDYAV